VAENLVEIGRSGQLFRAGVGALRRTGPEVTASMEQPSSHLKIKRADGVAVVEFADRKILEELSIQEIGDELSTLVDAEPGIKLLLNFKNVDHLSSAALGMLITLNRKVQQQNGLLKLSDINRQIFEVFKITKLNRVFEIHGSAEQALTGFGRA
jgi:anti-sigma B factor antagonist